MPGSLIESEDYPSERINRAMPDPMASLVREDAGTPASRRSRNYKPLMLK
jgi:hypothetical protein